MFVRWIQRTLAAAVLLAGLVPAAAAQLSNISVMGYTGVAVPVGRLSEYAKAGPSGGLQVEYPIRDPLAIVVDAGVDQPKSDVPGIPDLRMWRYQAGVAADILGRSAESWGVRGLLGAGATSFRTGGFYPNAGNVEERLAKTYVTGSGGLALHFGARSRVHGHVGARVHWTPVRTEDLTSLRDSALSTAAPATLRNVLRVPITLGMRVQA